MRMAFAQGHAGSACRGVPELAARGPRALGQHGRSAQRATAWRWRGARGAGPWVRADGDGSVRSCGVCPCGVVPWDSRLWCPLLPVSGLSGMKAGRPGAPGLIRGLASESEPSPLLVALCAGGRESGRVVAESRGACVRAPLTPGSASPLTTARIPTIPGRKTHFNS